MKNCHGCPGILYWFPRILTILIIGFFALMATDVFSMGYSFPEAVIGYAIHVIPAILLAVALAVAWKDPKTGGIIFLLLGLASVVFFHTYQDPVIFSIVSAIPLLIGAAFAYEGWYGKAHACKSSK